MPQIIVLQPFKWAHHGYQVEEFAPADEPVTTTDECAAVAVPEGWARLADAPAPLVPPAPPAPPEPATAPAAPENTAAPAAPENRDAAAAPRRAR